MSPQQSKQTSTKAASSSKQPPANSSKQLKVDFNKAFTKAVEQQFPQAALTRSERYDLRLDASVRGVAADTVKTAIMQTATRNLCQKGYLVTLTCESSAPGKAIYVFDFTTERGREKFAVGVSMDTDRATYLVKKVQSYLP